MIKNSGKSLKHI